MARIKRTTRPIGDLVLSGSTLGSCAQDTVVKDCGEQLHSSEYPVRAADAENRSVEQGDADEVNVSAWDFDPPDARIDERCDEDNDVDIEDLGKEPTVEVASVNLDEVGRCAGSTKKKLSSLNPRRRRIEARLPLNPLA